MGNTGIITIYLFLIVLFSFLYTGMGGLSESEQFDIDSYMVVSNARERLDNNNGLFADILRYVLIPFLLLDALFYLFIMISYPFADLPAIITTIILAPLGILILFDYVLPWVRGN